jgi:hypothetical protein
LETRRKRERERERERERDLFKKFFWSFYNSKIDRFLFFFRENYIQVESFFFLRRSTDFPSLPWTSKTDIIVRNAFRSSSSNYRSQQLSQHMRRSAWALQRSPI